MPQPDEPYYCSQQIHVPPELPDILKQFTKAAIRTQPTDILAWSSAYFHAMANGEVPPVKDRIEMMTATQKTDSGLTPGLLRVLNRQLGPRRNVPVSAIEEKWKQLCLPKEKFDDLILLGNFTGDVEWLNFFALGCTSLSSDIAGTMKMVCEILTADPDGGAARIPYPLFEQVYKYLVAHDGEISSQHYHAVMEYLDNEAKRQSGYVQPRNFMNPHCPSLEGPQGKKAKR